MPDDKKQYLALLKKTYPTAADASAAKLSNAENLRSRPSANWALKEAAAELKRRSNGCAYLNDIADTFELAASLPCKDKDIDIRPAIK